MLDGNGQRSDICLMRNNQRTNTCSWEMHKDRVFGDGPREHLLWLENHHRGMSHMSCASIWPSRYGACQVLPRFQLAAGVARLRVRFILSARGHGWPRDIAPRARVRRFGLRHQAVPARADKVRPEWRHRENVVTTNGQNGPLMASPQSLGCAESHLAGPYLNG